MTGRLLHVADQIERLMLLPIIESPKIFIQYSYPILLGYTAAVVRALTPATSHPEPNIHHSQTLLIADGQHYDAHDVIEGAST